MYQDHFEKASFLSALCLRPHIDGVSVHRKLSFSKTESKVDLFEKGRFHVVVWTDESGALRKR